jgi:hypothetical protein
MMSILVLAELLRHGSPKVMKWCIASPPMVGLVALTTP